jgi:hypothetical protein
MWWRCSVWLSVVWDDTIWCRLGCVMAGFAVHGFFFRAEMNATLRRILGVLLDECGRFEPGLVVGDSFPESMYVPFRVWLSVKRTVGEIERWTVCFEGDLLLCQGRTDLKFSSVQCDCLAYTNPYTDRASICITRSV